MDTSLQPTLPKTLRFTVMHVISYISSADLYDAILWNKLCYVTKMRKQVCFGAKNKALDYVLLNWNSKIVPKCRHQKDSKRWLKLDLTVLEARLMKLAFQRLTFSFASSIFGTHWRIAVVSTEISSNLARPINHIRTLYWGKWPRSNTARYVAQPMTEDHLHELSPALQW